MIVLVIAGAIPKIGSLAYGTFPDEMGRTLKRPGERSSMISRARRLAVPLTGAFLAAGVVGPTPSPSSAATISAGPSDVTAKAASEAPAAAVAFWSPARLRAAKDYTEELGNS